ncbi:MAG: tripartite tricarboxylate transporter substrate binding protein [Betaproteobacteria bacterium]|nr:tripartite tricarboxylate transporter substrate binding protein [Betaproteobacteria bacterium]
MKRFGKVFSLLVLLCAATMSAGYAAQKEAQDFPRRPIRVVIPFAPGGATDIVARQIGPALGERLGQQLVVDNRPGAAGNIGVELVARAQPDGYTVLLGNVSTSSINPLLFASKLQVKPEKDLAGVTLLVSVPNLIVSGAGFAPRNFKELVEYAKARPGQLNYSNPLGAYSHLDMLDFTKRAGIQMVNVPSKGAGATVPALISGEIHFSIMNAASAIVQVRAGRMKAYATTAQQRITDMPDIPTLVELGFPGIGSDNWNGFFVPSRTPRGIVGKLYQAAVEVIQRKDIEEAFAKRLARVTVSQSPEDFDAFVRNEMKRWGRIIKENNVKLD